MWSVANAGGAAAPEPEPEPEPSPSEGRVASPDFSFQGAVTEDTGEACIFPTTVSRRRELRGERRGLTRRFQYLALGCLRKQHALQRSVKAGLLGVPGGDTLLGKTALIVGFGNIGKELAVRLKPFGVRLLSVRRSPWGSQGSELERRAEAALDAKGGWGQLHAFAGEADIVFPTVAQNAETKGFVGRDFLSACKEGVTIVNVSRGGVLDYEAVLAGLEAGKIGAMGLDVQWSEPFDPTDPLAQRDDVILTPHVGGVTSISYAGMARFLADQCIRLAAENKPPVTSINCSQDWEFHT